MKMEPIVSSETSAIRTQTPGNYPKRNNLHLEHGESLRTRFINSCFIISLLYASTCFEHHVLIRRSKFYYTASGITTPVGGRPEHRLGEDSKDLCTGWPPIGVVIPDAV